MAYFAKRRRGMRHQWLLGFAIIAAATVFAWQTSGTRPRGPAPLSPQEQALSDHCAEFVTLAKTNFGADWKARLPAQGPCAKAIEQAWASEQAQPATAVAPQPTAPSLIAPPALPTLMAPPTEVAATPVEDAATAKAESPGRLDTYCLNILWLARSKFGDDWKSHLTPREAAKCAAHGRHLR